MIGRWIPATNHRTVCTIYYMAYVVWSDVDVSEALWVAILDAEDVQVEDVVEAGEEHVKYHVPVPTAEGNGSVQWPADW